MTDETTPTPQFATKEPWLATGLSQIFPGLGQFYAGCPIRGVFFSFTSLGLIYGVAHTLVAPKIDVRWCFILISVLLLLNITNLFDAHRSTRKKNSETFETNRKASKDPWLAVFLTRLIPGLGHFYLGKWLTGISALILFGVTLASAAILKLDGNSWTGRATEIIFPLLCVWIVAVASYISVEGRRENSLRTIMIFLTLGLCSSLIAKSGIYLHRHLVAQPFAINGRSMLPTLQPGDRIIVRKVNPEQIECGDIIAFRYPENPITIYVKRVAAVGPSTVVINPRNGTITADDMPLSHPAFHSGGYHLLTFGSLTTFAPDLTWYLSSQSIFVLGDNSALSKDSRTYDGVPLENLVGKVTKIFYPFNRAGPVNADAKKSSNQ